MNKKQQKIVAEFKLGIEEVLSLLAEKNPEDGNPIPDVIAELEEAYEGMSEKRQEGEGGQANQNERDQLQAALDALEQAKASLDEANDALNQLFGE